MIRAIIIFLVYWVLLLSSLGWTKVAAADVPEGELPLQVLVVDDPFGIAMRQQLRHLEGLVGRRIELHFGGYSQTHRHLLINRFRSKSRFDIVAVDRVWLAELDATKALLPLDGLVRTGRIDLEDFHSFGLSPGSRDPLLLLPMQPHAELLFYRRDLFASHGLTVPQTTEDLLEAARSLHGTEPGLSGLCWNGASGAPLGQTLLHFMAAYGGVVGNLNGKPQIDETALRSALELARSLISVSPPLILDMAWDGRIRHFTVGGCAMTYGWSARSAAFNAPGSRVRGVVAYAAAPHGPGGSPVTPTGTWLLGIPSNIDPERRALAEDALVQLVSRDAVAALIEAGMSASPLRSLTRDPGLQARYPVFATLADLEDRDQLHDWMRPSIPQFQEMTEILGTEAHQMLQGAVDIDVAVSRIMSRMARFEANPQPATTP